MRASSIASRVVARTGVALWRNRFAWGLGLVALLAVGVYQVGFAGPTTSGVNGDCADTAMAAVAQINDDAARAAYRCLGDSMKRSGEQQFVETLRDRGDLPKGHVTRVGDHRTSDGTRIVFYTVEAAGQAVGYIVYLDQHGLVQKIE